MIALINLEGEIVILISNILLEIIKFESLAKMAYFGRNRKMMNCAINLG